MSSLFEDHLGGQYLRLASRLERIAVHRQADLPAAWKAIEQARAAGHWVALLLDYELGEWLDPALARQAPQHDSHARLCALVYAHAEKGTIDKQPLTNAGMPDLAVHAGTSRETYTHAIASIRAAIACGDYYQVNYTMPLQLDWPEGLPPDQAYAYLAARHPVAHAACIQDGERWILSLSPELFVARSGTRLRTRPMKGTAPRHADPALDQQAAQALLASTKNRAENLMIVDLLRNDLGRIAVPGSVVVPSLFSLEAYPSVWTMTSTIEAEAPDVGLADVIRALFPCGSITGAPKLAAMQAIQKLENRRRGIYCGSVGWLAPDGDFSLNVAIRTIELNAGEAVFGVGGGIVHDSSATEEWEECLWKARILHPGS